jgi:Flp pilus assembly protein TadG
MLRYLLRPSRRTADERGQVVIIFAFAFVAVIMMLALLFDGAQALVLRRELQNASDAAAMAGANIIESLNPEGCSGNGTTTPQAAVFDAVYASVAANMPDYDPAEITVRCTPGKFDAVVEVQLGAEAPTFFGSIFGNGPLDVAADSSAINGQDAGNQYSVILLDNSNLSWANARRGCPSFLLSGGPFVKFDSSIYIDSACLRTNGGALSTNGNSATLILGDNGPLIRITGEYAPGSLVIDPAPVEHAAPKPDPIAPKVYQPTWWYPPPNVDNRPPGSTAFLSTNPTGLYVRKTAKYVIGPGGSNQTVMLEPGVYKGGIELRNSSVALMHPGVYVIQGGGFKVGAQASVYAVNGTYLLSQGPPANWAGACVKGSCGVLIYNTGDQTGSLAMDAISIGAGSTFKVRAYESTISNAESATSVLNNGTHFSRAAYDHLLLWQSADPRATPTWGQPEIHLNGGGQVEMIGTVYAPQAKVLVGGGSGGGSGSTELKLTLQFIVWDLELSGNATFHFVYDGNEFVVPPDYGLTE